MVDTSYNPGYAPYAKWSAQQAPVPHVIACLDARMNEVYWGCFAADPARGLAALGAGRVGPPDTVRPPAALGYQGIGRGFSAYPKLAVLPGLKIRPEDARALPNAREIAWLGSLRLGQGEGIDAADLQPLYLRDKVALTEAERAAK